jgi:hypothetical protein
MLLDGAKRLVVGDGRADERFRERAGPRHGRRKHWRRTARLTDDCRPAGDDDAAVGRGTRTGANPCAESIAKPDAFAKSNSNADSYSDADANTDPNANTDADSNADSNADTDANANSGPADIDLGRDRIGQRRLSDVAVRARKPYRLYDNHDHVR